MHLANFLLFLNRILPFLAPLFTWRPRQLPSSPNGCAGPGRIPRRLRDAKKLQGLPGGFLEASGTSMLSFTSFLLPPLPGGYLEGSGMPRSFRDMHIIIFASSLLPNLPGGYLETNVRPCMHHSPHYHGPFGLT